jgi:DNA mismatch repair protein MutS2
MDKKSLSTLELDKVLKILAHYCAFSASKELALNLHPTTYLTEAQDWQRETSEARKLLDAAPETTIGGARDVRQMVGIAERGGVLLANELLDVKATLVSARELKRKFARIADTYPRLAFFAEGLSDAPGIVEAISRTIDDQRTEVLDSASSLLASIRSQMRVTHSRILDKLQRILSHPDNAQYLQDPIVTERSDRFVIPVRSNFKGRIPGIVHDQSSSGQTIFIEPMATVTLNNEYRELQLSEAQEIRRILAELSALIAAQGQNILWTVENLASIDLAFAKAKYAEAVNATEPHLVAMLTEKERAAKAKHGTATYQHPGSKLRLYGVRHPLLDPKKVVPIDVELPPDIFTLIITGPNTGGKTVTLKTVGLAVLMAQCGLHVLADSGAELSVFQDVLADIGDEQSVEQSLSTFSGHITNIIRILQQADQRCLMIFDEMGAGTDPGEGAALARALLVHLLESGITTLGTTHYPELKAFAHTMPGVTNASVEFNIQTLAPTYRLMIGLPGRSNAIAIAQRLGLPDNIIQLARNYIGITEQTADDLLDEIYRQRDAARAERQSAAQARRTAQELENKLAKRLEKLDDERQKALAEVREQAQQELSQLREEMRQLRKKLALAQLPLESLKKVEQQVTKLDETAVEIGKKSEPAKVEALTVHPTSKVIRLGDRVRVLKLDSEGVVVAITATEAEVQVGRLRLRTSLDELERLAGVPNKPAREEKAPTLHSELVSAGSVSPGMELDLRGERVEDALEKLERYLDSAALSDLPWVRVIHGKGTGRVRQAVRDLLRHHPQVKSYESGDEKEGGDGVTVVKLG